MGKFSEKIRYKLHKNKEPQIRDERYRCKLMGKCTICKQHTQKYNCNIYKEQIIPASIWCGQEDCNNFIEKE